jgi:hypothetical protein
MSYTDVVICIGLLPFLETWPPIYRGQERTARDRLKANQVHHHVYFRYAPCLTDFTFEFIRRPTSPILSPPSRTFVELTLVTSRCLHPWQLSHPDHRAALLPKPPPLHKGSRESGGYEGARRRCSSHRPTPTARSHRCHHSQGCASEHTHHQCMAPGSLAWSVSRLLHGQRRCSTMGPTWQ